MKIKVCCIQSVEEARLATSLGVDAIGLVSNMPNGSGYAIAEEVMAEIVLDAGEACTTVLLTPEVEVERVVRQQQVVKASALQLVGPIRPAEVASLKGELGETKLIKVIHVQDSTSVEFAREYSVVADALLLDTQCEQRTGVLLGGTGMTHDWSISRQIVDESLKPVILAGGLSAENVAGAIRFVRPFGVDVCSSLRPKGSLDEERLAAFIARSANPRGFGAT